MKTLLTILAAIYVLGELYAIRKGNRVKAAYQLFWALAIAAVMIFGD